MPQQITRREFLKGTAAGTVALSLGLPAHASGSPSPLPKRPLGSTGLEVTLLGLGCVAIGYGPHSVAEGARIVEACIDAGINYIDCASSYGNGEVKVGEVLKSRRNEVILATKTLERSYEDAWREINRSLERLKTDYVDLLQIHSINRIEELDRITGPDGSLQAAIRAKESGMCRHIGITGHTRPEVIKEALNRYPFATTLVPLSSTDAQINDFGKILFPLAEAKRFGVIAMKVLAAGRVTQYASESLRYAMSLPVATAIVGMGTLEEVKENVETARNFKPMTKNEMTELERKTKTYATTGVMWWKRP
ncbi:MAG TPA: aldo/keto reductase [Bacteroidota bacterium]|nr:aldo/keto reductase [Bacteroidota bacterium]